MTPTGFASLKEKLNDISLLLMMTTAEDATGIALLIEMCDGLSTAASNEPSASALVKAWQEMKPQQAALGTTKFFEQLTNFVTCATRFLEDPNSAAFDSSASVGATASITDLIGVDPAFLSEFIETHRMGLEDFEGMLLNAEFGSQGTDELDRSVKAYIHNIKGDAGSIGLKDIEQVCHTVEDMLITRPASTIGGQLLLLKEWIGSCLLDYAEKKTPADSAESFLKRFSMACELMAPKPTAKPEAKPALTEATASTTPSQPATYKLSGEMDVFQEFIAEATEHLNNVETVMLEAEGNYSRDNIDTIFRGIHSLKGGSAYFTLSEMTETSHKLENILDEVRSSKREMTEELTTLVLSYIDLQKILLNSARKALAGDGTLTRVPESAAFMANLTAFLAGAPQTAAAEVLPPEPVAAATSVATATTKPAPSKPEQDSNNGEDKLNVKNFVKVDTSRLDHLVDSIGEMVIYSSILIRMCRQHLSDNEDVVNISHRVEKFARDLQDIGMSMRLVPVKGLFQKMSRLVWDTAKKIKKDVAFSMDGEDTELDRNLIDKLADPLMHMVRNAIDHGIEPPDEREKAGKPRAGKVHLSASQSGGSILIRIVDDGRGLNPEKLLAKAIEKGVVTPDQKLSEQEIFQLIFAAGFSTAAVVTDISGRGVGMDVVRRNVESLRGRIHIESTVGKGSIFTIELPLTLAIVDGIEVTVGSEHFIIPSLSIVEFVRPKEGMLNRPLDSGETFHFRGKYLPVFRICDLYAIEPKYRNPSDSTFVIVENHDQLVAIMVDDIVGELSTVIKSLGPMFEEAKGVSGCAVMPNGDVALILDVRSLVALARKTYRPVLKHSEPTQSNTLH